MDDTRKMLMEIFRVTNGKRETVHMLREYKIWLKATPGGYRNYWKGIIGKN